MMTIVLLLAGLALTLAVVIAAQRMLREQAAARLVLANRLGAMQVAGDAAPRGEARWLAWIEARIPAFLERNLARADKAIGARFLIGYAIALAVMLVLAGLWAGALGVGLALLAGVALPLVWVRHLADRRIARFVDALPHFLDSIRQLLLVGYSFQQALTRAVERVGRQGP